jgi:hypothetical protein
MGIALPEAEPAEDFEIFQENWLSVEMFLRCQTQWRASINGVLGLDYGAVAWILRLYEVEEQRAVLEDLQIMESAAMAKLNERGD